MRIRTIILAILLIGLPSIMGAAISRYFPSIHQHNTEWYEVDANNLAYDYFDKRGMTTVTRHFGTTRFPLDFNPDWYSVVTLIYYIGIASII